MKPTASETIALLRDPSRIRAILLHGDDIGLIRERAEILVRAAAGTLDDPFRAATLDREEHNRLTEEAGALSLMGGRRAVRVRDVGEAILAPLQRALAAPGDALLVLEAPGLGKGKLRTFVEASRDAAAIACYPDDRATLAETVKALLRERAVAISAEALEYLLANLGADRQATNAEIEKLSLYAGPGGRVELEDAEACVGDGAAVSLDEAMFAATAGDLEAADRALGRALAEGVGGVGVLRQGLSHLQRLHQCRLMIDAGQSAQDAMRALRPPVFFRRTDAFRRALGLWSAEQLARAIEEQARAEAACKRTGARDEVLASRFVLTLGRHAAQQRRR